MPLKAYNKDMSLRNFSILMFCSDGKATFADLSLSGTVLGAQLSVSCQDQADNARMAWADTSSTFYVYPNPNTGELKETQSEFSFVGLADDITPVLEAFQQSLAI